MAHQRKSLMRYSSVSKCQYLQYKNVFNSCLKVSKEMSGKFR